MRPGTVLLAGLAALVAMSTADETFGQENTPNPVIQTFDSFSLSLMAGSRCDSPDDETMNDFIANLLAVQEMTIAAYQSSYPDLSAERVEGLVNDRILALGDVFEGLMKSQGCDHPDIVRLLRLFHINAQPGVLLK